jgi:FkbM family methyltransferase
MNSAYATFWYRCFPNMKLINIIRDGRDVACSLRNVVWGTKDYKKGVDWWANNVSNAFREQRHLPKNAYLNVKYEDLVVNRDETLKNIVDFLEIEWSDSLYRIEISNKSAGRWKNELPEYIFDYINEKHNRILEFLGYDLKERPIHKNNEYNGSEDKQYYLNYIKSTAKEIDINVWGVDSDNLPYVKMKNGLIFYGMPIKNTVRTEVVFDYEIEVLKSIYLIIEDIQFRYLRKREIIQDSKYCIKLGDTIVEVGAYLGYYSMYLSEKVGAEGKVFAIELIPDNFQVLKKNLEANFKGVSHAINIGIDNRNGESNAYSGGGQICSLRKDVVAKYKQDYDSVPVRVSTMDNILNQYNCDEIDFMTIQINGTEVEAFQGMQKYIKKVKNFAIAAPYGKYGRNNVNLVKNILTENGFDVIVEKTMVYAKNRKYYG